LAAEPEPWIIEQAVAFGRRSPCAKSKRGVVILRENGQIVGAGFNHPPGGLACTGDAACWADCGKLCVHAEMSALRDVGTRGGPLEVVHIKVVDGLPVPGGGPSCSPCARDMLDDGRVVAVWLFELTASCDRCHGLGQLRGWIAHDESRLITCPTCKGRPEQASAWRRYPIVEFYEATMRACRLPILGMPTPPRR
jgi:deoxycytidylate deaminase